jgi:hypothetical protein
MRRTHVSTQYCLSILSTSVESTEYVRRSTYCIRSRPDSTHTDDVSYWKHPTDRETSVSMHAFDQALFIMQFRPCLDVKYFPKFYYA